MDARTLQSSDLDPHLNFPLVSSAGLGLLLFIIRVKRDLKRVYRNGCRYNERLNTETGGSKTSRIHWVARVNIQ